MISAFSLPAAPALRRPVLGSLALAVVFALAGCGSLGGFSVEGDNAPHPGVNRARDLPIQGIDVARYQGDIDYRAVRRAGVRFVYIKSTDGGDYVDPAFRENWNRAAEAGLARGAYHFIYWCRPAEEQAAWFIQNVPADPYALPPVLDLEWNHQSSCTRKPDREEALHMIRVILAAMEQHTGKVPVIYTDMTFHRDVLEGVELDNPFWLRSVAAEPHQRYQRRGFTFWQYTQTGVVRGVRGEVDRNAFYGSEEEWTTFLLTGCDPRMLERLGPQGRCGSIK
jgi:lysozyme